jgi:hypothetical protein
MTGGKPTPGPWSAFVVGETMTVAVDIGPHPSGKRPNVVDWTGFDTCGLPFDQQVANARLIAAAPDLLAAQQGMEAHMLQMQTACVQYLTNQMNSKEFMRTIIYLLDGPEQRAIQEAARAAIAKAEGGAA